MRVVIGSDHAIYRRGLASLFLSIPEAQLVGEAKDEAEVAQLCGLVLPDLVLLDFKSPLESGKDLALALHQNWPKLRVILVVGVHDEIQAEDTLDSGITLYFPNDISEEEFIAAVKHLAQEVSPEPRKPAPRRPPAYRNIPEPVPAGPSRRGKVPEAVDLEQSPSRPDDQFLTRELVMAGRIQADILPEKPPEIPGWEISARLESARETSGDFYDFIPLANGNWGIVIADVTDKGMGAALFMALTSSLIRTYAARYPTLPALAIDAVNDRILTDTRGSMFVTAFYGVLEPRIGRFRFVNAGHPPAFVVSKHRSKPVDRLGPTGKALGLIEHLHWQQKVCRLNPEDVLVLYTDGITEAQNPQGEFFGDARLLEAIRSKSGCPAREVQDAVLAEMHHFVGDIPRQDDIALIVICRKD